MCVFFVDLRSSRLVASLVAVLAIVDGMHGHAMSGFCASVVINRMKCRPPLRGSRLSAKVIAEISQKVAVPRERRDGVMILALMEDQVTHLGDGQLVRVDELVLRNELVISGKHGLLTCLCSGPEMLCGTDLDVPRFGLLAASVFGLTQLNPPGHA